MSYIFPLIISIFGGSMLSVITKKRFLLVLPIFYMLSALIVYLSIFFNAFYIAYYLIISFAFLFPLYLIYKKVKKQKILPILKNTIDTGTIIFILIYTFIFILNYNRGFNTWDEFSHWGVMVKEMYSLKDFYNSASSVLTVHRDYPPIVTIFETIWTMFSGSYSEAHIYTGLQILSISFILPFFANIKFKKAIKYILEIIGICIVTVSIPLIINVGEAAFYSTIYTDPLLGILLFYGFGLIVITKKVSWFHILSLTTLFSFMILTKQMGIAFIALLIATFVMNLIVLNWGKLKCLIKINYKKILIYGLILVSVPFIFNYSWERQVKLTNSESQFSLSNIKLSKLYGIYTGYGDEAYQTTTMHNYIDAIIYNVKFVSILNINMTYWQLMIITSVMLYLIYLYAKEIFKKKQIISLIFCINCGAIAYAFALMLLYVFCFGSYEGPNLACITRYVNTYWYAIFLLITSLFMYAYIEKKKDTISDLFIFISVLWTFWFSGETINKLKPVFDYESTSFQVYADTDIIEKYLDKDDSVFVVAQNTVGLQTFLLQYMLVPNKVSLQYYSVGDKYYEGDVWTQNITAEAWIDYIVSNKYDYLYIFDCDDAFINKYGKYFDSKNIVDKQIYRVDVTNKSLELVVEE